VNRIKRSLLPIGVLASLVLLALRPVGARHDTVFEVVAFDTDYQRHDLLIRVREVADETGTNDEKLPCN
jgi:hypothetical protein